MGPVPIDKWILAMLTKVDPETQVIDEKIQTKAQ